VQVNGKRRSEINVSTNAEEDEVLEKAKSSEKAATFIEGKEIVKEIYVKGRIVNIVVR
jgi:leucyl-tRNA synthetase